MKEQFEHCERAHSQCNLFTDEVFPSRLIDIGALIETDTEETSHRLIYLIETKENKSPAGSRYVCLSRRWGSPGHTFTTKVQTLEARKSGIALSDLSQVFRDTIYVLRKFDIRYVWIDSLCIVQDSKHDWESEAAKMAEIYSRAYFTLARQCDDSCGTPVTRLSEESIDKKIDVALEGLDVELVYVRYRVPHLAVGSSSLDEHFLLNTRGWIYQERLLSSRVVHYTNREIVWECNETTVCQCKQPTEAHREYKRLHAQALDLVSPPSNADLTKIATRWRCMVSEYTWLNLTMEKDRLAAFQGCAMQVAHRREGRYLFGLWEDSLLHDMLWVVPSGATQRSLAHLSTPSWSWASFQGKIEFEEVAQTYACANHLMTARKSRGE